MNALTPTLTGTALSTASDAERFRLEIRDGVPRVDSRVIAQRFEKRHSDVLRSIDLLVQRRPDLALRNFAEGSYTSPLTGQQRHRNFLVDRDGFALLAMGFTGDAALAWKLDYLDAFNRMEAELRRRQTPALDLDDNQTLRRLLLGKLEENDALRATAEAERLGRIEAEGTAAEANQDFLDTARALTIVTTRAAVTETRLAQQTDRVEALQPKAIAYERLAGGRDSKLISIYAKELKIQQKRLFEILDDKGWIFQRTSRELRGRKGPWLASSFGIDRGFVEMPTESREVAGLVVSSGQLKITAKGQRIIDAQLAQGSLNLRPRRR